MRTIGWVYLFAYTLDAVLSLAATFKSSLESTSNAVSSLVTVFTLVVFIMACAKSLAPRRLFIILSSYYFSLLALGAVSGMALLMKLGPEAMMQTDLGSVRLYGEQFSWFWPVYWTMLVLWFCMVLYGFIGFVGRQKQVTQVEGT